MACLYIDQLKSNFQRAHHFSQRANNGEIWCPRSSINRLCNYKCEHTPEANSKISVSVKFKPAAPKIFTIGLHPDYEDTSNDYFYVTLIDDIKQILKEYLDYIVRRYRRYFRSSSKLVSTKSCNRNMCSFNSLVSIVSKCSKEFAKNIWDASKGSNHSTLRHRKHHRSPNERSHKAQTLSSNTVKPNYPDKRTLYVEHRQDSQKVRKKMHRHSSAVNTENEDVRSTFGSRSERVVDRTASSDRSNAPGDLYSNYNDSPIPVAKRSVCVQTSRKSKSRSKDHRKKKRDSHRKENTVLVSTGMSSSQDVRTIFRTNSEDFNRKESNLNLDLLETRRKKTACVVWRTEEKSRSNTLPDEKDNLSRKRLSGTQHSKSKENNDLTMIYQKCKKQNPSEIKTILTNNFYNNIEMSETAMRSPVQFDRNSSIPALHSSEEVFLANSIETLCDSASLYETVKASQTSRDFQAEDKSSETIILGNIKKRLEEDYDDYFSFDEFDDDAFETWPKLTSKIDQTSSDSTINYRVSRNKSETTTPMLKTESPSKYQKPKHSEHNFLTARSTNQNRKESSQANLTYAFSIHCTNSNLSHSQSSYYTPSQEQDDSPCSSVEYCSATNNSSSNFSRTSPNLNLLTTVRTHPLNTGVTSICSLETSPLSIRSPDDVLSKSNPIFQSSGERFSETMINSRAMQIRRRRSSFSNNLSNSSKLITKSFDSGVLLTDYSRDHVLSSSERSRKTRTPINRSERSCCAREPSALPTYDFNSDSSYSDDSLNRRLEVVVKQFTEDLVLTERKVRLKLRRSEKPSRSRQHRRRRPRRQQVQKTSMCIVQRDSMCDLYWSHDDDKIASSSTPPIFSLSDSEIDHI